MRYRFTHPFREIFTDLQHGVNALVHPAGDAAEAPAGSTVVLAPGDELETKTGYPHPHLELVDDAVSEAAAVLANVQKSDVVTELADALRAERSADAAAHEAPADQSAPVVQSEAAPVEPPAAPVVPEPAAPTAEVPAAVPAVETPAETPVAAPVETPVETPAPAPAAAPAAEAPAAS